MNKDDINLVINYSNTVLSLGEARLSNSYFYQSLPLCVIDSVFSIGVRYEGVERTVKGYCDFYGLNRFRSDKHSLPEKVNQESISDFCVKFEKLGEEKMASSVFCNRQRTSTKNGILKSRASYEFACVLKAHGVEFFQNVEVVLNNESFSNDILKIPGQKSGIALKYFLMLAGSDDLIKPDRMIISYLERILKRKVNNTEAQNILVKASENIKLIYNNITPRLLDHEIWKYERSILKS